MDLAKKEYISKLKKELETVESRFYDRLEQITMVCEDYHSRAAKNLIDYELTLFKFHDTNGKLDKATKTIEQRDS